MKVLVNAMAAKMGGALGHLRALVRELDRRRSPHDWTFLVDRSIYSLLPKGTVGIRAVAAQGPAARIATDQLLVPVWGRRTGADVIVSLLNHGPRLAGLPHVVFQRNAWYFDGAAGRSVRTQAQRAFALAACRGASAVVVPTHTMARAVASVLGTDPPVVVIPHGVDIAYFAPGESYENELGDSHLVDAGRPRLVYVALASRHKGHGELLDAFRVLTRSLPSASLALTIGPDEPVRGGDRERAERLVAEASDMPGVRFLGRCGRDRVRALYDWADIAVFPSHLESFGFPLVEAMAMQVPIVATNLPVSRELAGKAAVYYPIGDGAALASQVLRLSTDPELRRELAAAGRRRAQRFSIAESVARLEDLVEAVGARRAITASEAWS